MKENPLLPYAFVAMRILMERHDGVFGSELVHLSNGALSRGTVYTLLQRMEADDLVKSVEVPVTSEYRVKRVKWFRTVRGEELFDAALKQCGLCLIPLNKEQS